MTSLGNSHRRHLRIIRVHRGRRPWVSGLLRLLDKDVVLGEDTLLPRPQVSAHPPVGVHVLVNRDAVVLFEADVPRILAVVGVERTGVGKYGFDRGRGLRRLVSDGEARGAGLVVGWRRVDVCFGVRCGSRLLGGYGGRCAVPGGCRSAAV